MLYTYDAWGNLTNVVYSDGTPPIAYAYDNRGNILFATVDGVATNNYAYDLFGRLTNEVQNGAAIARTRDALGRDTGYVLSFDGGGRFMETSLPGSAGRDAPTARPHDGALRGSAPLREVINGSGGAGGSPAEPLSSVTYAYDHIGRLSGAYFHGGDYADNTLSNLYADLEIYAAINPPGSRQARSSRTFDLGLKECAGPSAGRTRTSPARRQRRR